MHEIDPTYSWKPKCPLNLLDFVHLSYDMCTWVALKSAVYVVPGNAPNHFQFSGCWGMGKKKPKRVLVKCPKCHLLGHIGGPQCRRNWPVVTLRLCPVCGLYGHVCGTDCPGRMVQVRQQISGLILWTGLMECWLWADDCCCIKRTSLQGR